MLFLASDEAKYITGIELTVDGGFLLEAARLLKKKKGKAKMHLELGNSLLP